MTDKVTIKRFIPDILFWVSFFLFAGPLGFSLFDISRVDCVVDCFDDYLVHALAIYGYSIFGAMFYAYRKSKYNNVKFLETFGYYAMFCITIFVFGLLMTISWAN